MRHTLQVLLQLQGEGTLTQFAIGGAIAASFYAPAVTTEDLDVFAFLKPSVSGLLVLTPLYDRIKELGGVVENAPEHSFEDLKVRVVDANYLCAIALQTGRSKDYQRIHTLIESGSVDILQLKTLIENYNLIERWETYERRFA